MDEPKLPPLNPSTPSSLEGEVRQLRETVLQLSARVLQLEQKTGGSQGAPAPTPVDSRRLESRFGLTLVNRAGAITLAIGIIFFFKYAADNKWIGAETRVAIGVVAGILMLCGAEWMRPRKVSRDRDSDRGVFTQGLAGCGLATVYVSLYAAFAYYKLIVPVAGWSLLVLVSACAVVLSIRYSSAVIAALGFTGAFLTPMLLHNKASSPSFDFSYLLVAGVTALAIAVRNRWSLLVPSMAALGLLAAAVTLEGHHPGAFAAFAVCLGVAHFAGARFGGEGPFRSFAYLAAHACVLTAAVRLTALWTAGSGSPDDRYSFTSALESVLLATYGTCALIFGMVRKSVVDRALGLFLLGLVIVKLYLWDIWQLNMFYRISAFVALGILLLAASYLYSRFRSRTT